MQKNFHLEERLSFARPNAESTMNGTFQWGRKTSNNSTISQHSKTTKSPQKNLVKVDARVYTDVHSRGLASRIVKYHENGTRFNRSISMTNLSGKSSSPLSVKKLEAKPQLRYDKAVKQNVSMTHIAPPDKSLFYGNTLSGLLRSSSVIALSPNDDDLSSENRPIIHPPVTEKELQPTRSVLEVLKEISRKRINNEVLQENDEVADNSKKYCGRLADAASHYSISNDYRLQQMHAQQAQTPPQPTPLTYKRQRESAVDGYMPTHCLSREPNVAFQAKTQQTELTASPEQQSKRRYCNYNNDITSSLSSSVKGSTAKRKLCVDDGYKRQEKLLRYQHDVRLPEITTALSYQNKLPITPLPNTPQTVSKEMPITAALVQKSASAPLPVAAAASEVQQNQVVKPKLTLFNRNYEPKDLEATEASETQVESNDDDNAYAGINFVKPKKSATSIGGSSASNLVMERTRKSKLALMLSGLRGEIYLGDEEEAARLKHTTSNEEQTKDATKQQQATVTNTFLSSQSLDKPDANEPPKQPAVANVTSSASLSFGSTVVTTATTTMPTTKITSPLTGIKLTPIATTTTAAATSQAATTTTAPTFNFNAPGATTTTAAPTFNFNAPTATTTTATAAAAAPKPSFSFGAPAIATPASTTVATTSFGGFGATVTTANMSTAVPAVTTTTSFAFGTPATAATAPAFQIAPANTTAGTTLAFNFNANADSSKAAAATTSAPTTTLAAGFNFSSNASNTSSTTSSTATPAFSFGGLAASQTGNKPRTTTAAPAFNFNSKPPAASFSFGNNSAAATANTATTTTEAPKAFSFSAATKAANPLTGGAFAFGSNANNNAVATAQQTAPATSLFGAAPAQTAAPPAFGAQQAVEAKNATPPTNAFMFGAKPAAQTATVAPVQPTFGAIATPAQNQAEKNPPANSFLFGGGTNATPTKPSFGATSSNNLFGGNANPNNNSLAAATTANEPNKPSNAFSFSNAAQQPKAFSFGGANTTTNAASDATKSTNLFGAALGGNNQQSKTFSFGGPSAAVAATNVPAASSSFNFSNANQGNTINNNNNSSNTNAFAFGVSSSNNANNNNTNKLAFGATDNKQSSGGAFTFGQANQTNNNNGIFSFNAKNATATTTNQQPTSNSKPATNNTFGSPGGGFVFGAAANKTPAPSFGAPTSTSATPSGGFVFGAAAQQQQNSVTNAKPATGNLFATPSAPAATPQQSANLFGGAANAAATSNIFGSNATNSAPVFGAAPAAAPNTATPAANNLFAIPASNGSEQRPIRRATRRLAKP